MCVAPATLLEYSNGGAKVAGTGGIIIGYQSGASVSTNSEQGAARMNVLRTPSSARAERKRSDRLVIARRLYQALVAQDPDRLITLRDGGGRVVARHDPARPEQGDEYAS